VEEVIYMNPLVDCGPQPWLGRLFLIVDWFYSENAMRCSIGPRGRYPFRASTIALTL